MLSKHKNISLKVKILLLLLLLAVVAGVVYFVFIRDSRPVEQKVAEQQLTEQGINLSPPTEEDEKRADDNKTRIVQEQEAQKNQSQNPASQQSIKPFITYAEQYNGNVEVGAYVSLFEEGGTCTATFTKGAKTLTREVAAVRGANSVDCPVMSAPASEFVEKGTWQVVVDYKSSTAQGSSDPRQVEVK